MDERVFALRTVQKKAKLLSTGWSRDQRVEYNFGLLKAAEYASKNNLAIVVCFCLVPEFSVQLPRLLLLWAKV